MARGPQDLPASRVLLITVTLGYFAIGAAVNWPLQSPGQAVLMAGFDVALLFGFAALLLAWRGHPARWLQTVTALVGSGVIIGIIALPIIFSLYRAMLTQTDATLMLLVYWVLVGWIIAIYGHIFTQALSLRSRWAGLGVALVYFALSLVSVEVIFPRSEL